VKYKTLRANPGARHHRVAVNGMRLSRAGMEHAPTSATGTGWERTPWPRDAAGGVGGGEEDVRVNGKKIGGAMTRVSPLLWLPSSVRPGGYCSIAGSTLRPGSR
jgi:hypothetical protein